MAVYKYTGTIADEKDRVESGTVVADSPESAREKLRKYRFEKVKLRKVSGMSGFFMGFTASVK